MTEIQIICYNEIFSQNALCLSRRTGYKITKTIDKPIYYIVYGAHVNPTAMLQYRQTIGCKFIVFNTEHYSSPVFSNKFYIELLKQSYIIDYLPANREWLAVNYRLYVLSFHWFEFIEQEQSLVRPIDILFVGAKSDKRQSVERNLVARYPDKTIHFIYPEKYTDITNILKSAVTVLNIEFYENNFELHRINQALSCGCKVISHNTTDMANLYNNFVSFTNDYESCINSPTKTYRDLVENQLYVVSMHLNWCLQMISERPLDQH